MYAKLRISIHAGKPETSFLSKLSAEARGHYACAIVTKTPRVNCEARKMATPNKVVKRDAKNNHGAGDETSGNIYVGVKFLVVLEFVVSEIFARSYTCKLARQSRSHIRNTRVL